MVQNAIDFTPFTVFWQIQRKAHILNCLHKTKIE
jgi:hypothetical protein